MAKKESSVKTNAARMLDAAGIHYELREYTVDEDDLSAPSVAAKIGMPPEQVFKTLVARGDRTGVLIACIPANAELDLKALAAASGNKKVELVPVKEVLGLTGYIRGGVSPIGTRKPYPFYLEETGCAVGRHLGQRRRTRLPIGPRAGRSDTHPGSAVLRHRQELKILYFCRKKLPTNIASIPEE